VPEAERQTLVNRVFAEVAERYDLMNDLMSGGLHRLWKDDLVAALNPPRRDRPFQLLDVAGGTGDVAIRYARASGPNACAVLCDISPEMIGVGRRRASKAHLDHRITFALGNAEALPFPDRSFDAYTIAFGIRNVTQVDKALAEAYRVLKTGGRFLPGTSAVQVLILDKLYDFHPSRSSCGWRSAAVVLPLSG
jgi:demethylmenaquinone methyltransferase/2-methoxy-6-polyprenyl-1,4-benzoquinol methylase